MNLLARLERYINHAPVYRDYHTNAIAEARQTHYLGSLSMAAAFAIGIWLFSTGHWIWGWTWIMLYLLTSTVAIRHWNMMARQTIDTIRQATEDER